MFDLEQSVSSWSDYLRSTGKLGEADVVELENHLREEIDDLTKNGLSEDEAFFISIKRLGNVSAIAKEYAKAGTEKLWKQMFVDPILTTTTNDNQHNILLVVLFSLLAGTAAKIPTLLGLDMESLVYLKNISFYILPFIILYFALRNTSSKKLFWYIAGIIIFTGVVINLYPSSSPNHTETLIAIHLPILMWLITGVAYTGERWMDHKGRMDFLRFTGESVIYGSLIMLGLMVLVMIIAIMFQSISIDVSRFIGDYFIIYAGSAAAMITVFLVETKKSIVENFAPILAKIFSPMFLIVMVIFLTKMALTGNSPFIERDFLIGFNLILILVLGMVIYIISARNVYDQRSIFDYLNTALIGVAIIVDVVALSAIIFRLSEYGVSPNKLAALGLNILLLINLAVLLILYIRYFIKQIEFEKIEIWQTKYLTIYMLWLAAVVFIFPVAFRFS
jgi:hypothetical protein